MGWQWFISEPERPETRISVEKVVTYLSGHDSVVEDFGCIFVLNILEFWRNLRENNNNNAAVWLL